MKLEDLEVYQLSEKLSDQVWEICTAWERFPKYSVGKQLVDSADSISANISEGHGRYSLRENLQFCYYARGSYEETRNWLRRAFQRKLLTKKQVDQLKKLLDELGPKLNAYINYLKRKSKEK